MSDVDAAPHATPDQVRAAEKRREAALAAGGRVAEAPEERHAPEAETTARTSKTAKRAAKKA